MNAELEKDQQFQKEEVERHEREKREKAEKKNQQQEAAQVELSFEHKRQIKKQAKEEVKLFKKATSRLSVIN